MHFECSLSLSPCKAGKALWLPLEVSSAKTPWCLLWEKQLPAWLSGEADIWLANSSQNISLPLDLAKTG